MNRFALNYLSQTNSPLTLNTTLLPKSVFNKRLTFYVCSFGGSGSTVLFNYLSQFGNVEHVHDRLPPAKLTYVGNKNVNTETSLSVYSEWFNTIEVPEKELSNIKVIFIYRNPLDVIYSRFAFQNGQPHVEHLKHIMCKNNGNIKLRDVLNSATDLYGMEEFFDNYTRPNNRNYKIYCVKYEMFWDNIGVFNQLLGIPDIKQLYPQKSERKKTIYFKDQLNKIYLPLIKKMNSNTFIKLV